jgi:hypothetical protein
MYWRAQRDARLRHASAAGLLQREHDAEVGGQRASIVQQDILGFDVAMDDAAPMCGNFLCSSALPHPRHHPPHDRARRSVKSHRELRLATPLPHGEESAALGRREFGGRRERTRARLRPPRGRRAVCGHLSVARRSGARPHDCLTARLDIDPNLGLSNIVH